MHILFASFIKAFIQLCSWFPKTYLFARRPSCYSPKGFVDHLCACFFIKCYSKGRLLSAILILGILVIMLLISVIENTYINILRYLVLLSFHSVELQLRFKKVTRKKTWHSSWKITKRQRTLKIRKYRECNYFDDIDPKQNCSNDLTRRNRHTRGSYNIVKSLSLLFSSTYLSLPIKYILRGKKRLANIYFSTITCLGIKVPCFELHVS